MFKKVAIIACLTSAFANTAGAQTRDVHKHGKFFQNIKAEHVVPLLSGAAWVSHVDWDGVGLEGTGVGISWHSKTHRYVCQGSIKKNDHGFGKASYKAITDYSKFLNAKHPVVELISPGITEPGYDMLRYDSKTGGLTNYWYQQLKWWEMRTGHLQTEIPAVTWELCPDFPSAKSLGAKVNKKQTSKYYNTLIAQDPGKRVLKPKYEAREPTVIWLDKAGKPQTSNKRAE